ncbi:uncharacterized protein EV422DRAFT_340060 [Fimicolochytrium jonesii]|uniref:uncharacterized protein n=1 Tax=Fimicolochytrium jonesii TaxID=1396493 RepID=UPI0022FDCF6A|nr:uncharacterized protein EV422DRAFT_340060 [Fimicolochytrium jonesii]KAI8815890.1 hypothetical protein EV422DRAFT_340060 [Fimicolochytrium jonesii]
MRPRPAGRTGACLVSSTTLRHLRLLVRTYVGQTIPPGTVTAASHNHTHIPTQPQHDGITETAGRDGGGRKTPYKTTKVMDGWARVDALPEGDEALAGSEQEQAAASLERHDSDTQQQDSHTKKSMNKTSGRKTLSLYPKKKDPNLIEVAQSALNPDSDKPTSSTLGHLQTSQWLAHLHSPLLTPTQVSASSAWRAFKSGTTSQRRNPVFLRQVMAACMKDTEPHRRLVHIAKIYDRLFEMSSGQLTVEDRRMLVTCLSAAKRTELGIRELKALAQLTGWNDDGINELLVDFMVQYAGNGVLLTPEEFIKHHIKKFPSALPSLNSVLAKRFDSYPDGSRERHALIALVRTWTTHLLPTRTLLDRLLTAQESQITRRELSPQVLITQIHTVFANLTAAHPTRDRRSAPMENVYAMYLRLLHTCVKYNAHAVAAEIAALIPATYGEGATLSRNVILNSYFANGKFDRAMTLYRSMQVTGVPLTITTYNIVIGGCIKRFRATKDHRPLETAERIAEKHVEKTGLEKDRVYFNTMIKLKIARKDEAGKMRVLTAMQAAGFKPDSYTYGALIWDYVRSDNFEAAIRWAESARNDNVSLDDTLVQRILDIVPKQRVGIRQRTVRDGLRAMLKPKPEETRGVHDWGIVEEFASKPDGVGKQRLTFVVEKLAKEAVTARGEFSHADLTRKVNILLDRLVMRGRVGRVWALLDIFENGGVRTEADTYNVLLKGVCRTGSMGDIETAIKRMEDRGIKMDRVGYNTVIKRCCDDDALELANQYLRKMTHAAALVDVRRGHADIYGPDKQTYAMLIHAHGRNGHIDVAKRLLTAMRMRNVAPDAAVWRAMLVSYAHIGDDTGVDSTIAELEKLEGTTIRTYNTVIAGLTAGGFRSRALWWIDRIREAGIAFDAVLYNQVVNLHVLDGDMARAMDVVGEMRERNVGPDAVTYANLLAGWSAADDAVAVTTTMAEMKDLEIPLNERGYSTLIAFYAAQHEVEKAIAMFTEYHNTTVSSGAALRPEPFAAIIHGCGVHNNSLVRAIQFYELSQQKQIPPNASVITAIMQSHAVADAGSLDAVIHLFDRLRDQTGDEAAVGVTAAAACVALDACGHRFNVTALEYIWSRLRPGPGTPLRPDPALRIRPQEWTNVYTSAIEAFVRCNRFAVAADILCEEMPPAGVAYDEKMFVNVLGMLEIRGAGRKAIRRVEEALGRWEGGSEEVRGRIEERRAAARRVREMRKGSGMRAGLARVEDGGEVEVGEGVGDGAVNAGEVGDGEWDGDEEDEELHSESGKDLE